MRTSAKRAFSASSVPGGCHAADEQEGVSATSFRAERGVNANFPESGMVGEGVTVVSTRVDARDALRGERLIGVEMSTLKGVFARPSFECGGLPSPLRDPRDASRFGERSRRTGCRSSGVVSSSLLLPFGSSGGVAATTGAEGEDRRERMCGARPGDLVRRPSPFPRCSHFSFSSSDDDDDNGLFAD